MTQPDEPALTDSPSKRHGDALDDVVQNSPQGDAGPIDGDDEVSREA